MLGWPSLSAQRCATLADGLVSACARDLLWLAALPASVALVTVASFALAAYFKVSDGSHSSDNNDNDAALIVEEENEAIARINATLTRTSTSVRLLVISTLALATVHAHAALKIDSSDLDDGLQFSSTHRFIAHIVQAVLAITAAVIIAAHVPSRSRCRPLSFAWACIPFFIVNTFTAWADWRVLEVSRSALSSDQDNEVLHSVNAHMIASALINSIVLLAAVYRYVSLANAVSDAALKPSTLPPESLETLASPWQRATFSWMSPLLALGYSRSLEMSDVWLLRRSDMTRYAKRVFDSMANKTLQPMKAGVLAWQLAKSVKGLLAYQLMVAIFAALGDFGAPFFLNRILTYIQSKRDEPSSDVNVLNDTSVSLVDLSALKPFLYVLGLFLTSTMTSFFWGQTFFTGRRVGTRIRASLIAKLYQKTLSRKILACLANSSCDEQTIETNDVSSCDKDQDDKAPDDQKLDVNVIISTDTQRTVEYVCYLHFIITSPMQVTICLLSLGKILGPSAFAGVALLAIMIPLQIWIGSLLERYQNRVMEFTDRRVSKMTELLEGIRVVKFFAWERNFKKVVLDLRAIEVSRLTKYWRLLALVNVLYHAMPTLVTLFTFFTYTKIAGNSLDAIKVFTSLSLFYTLRHPLWDLPNLIVRFYETRVAITRSARYLAQPNIERYQLDKHEYQHASKYRAAAAPGDTRVGLDMPYIDKKQIAEIAFINASFEWEQEPLPEVSIEQQKSSVVDDDDDDESSESENEGAFAIKAPLLPVTKSNMPINELPTIPPLPLPPQFRLQNLTIKFPEGGLTVILGPTGAGKSSLLHALLGEMKSLSGHVFLPKTDRRAVVKGQLHRGVAYVPQQAWLMNATIRDNITFGDLLDTHRYRSVLHTCALLRDLEILESGDKTEIGEKGINLSGGQKQRISLARACYNRAQNVLLDDVLSAVDAPTAAHIFEQCIAGPNAQLAGRTRILVTHNIGLTAASADWIVFMKDGRAVAQGATAEEVRDQVALLGLEEVSLFNGVISPSSTTPESASCSGSTTHVNSDNKDQTQNKGKYRLSLQSSVPTMSDSGEKNDRDKGLIDGNGDSLEQSGGRGTRLIQDEEKATGTVGWHVYLTYIDALGGWLWVAVMLVGIIVPQLILVGQDWWLKVWVSAYNNASSDALNTTLTASTFLATSLATGSQSITLANHRSLISSVLFSLPSDINVGLNTSSISLMSTNAKTEVDVNYYLSVYAVLTVMTIFVSYGFTLVEIRTTVCASQRLHGGMFDRVLRAPVSFFDKTPLGRLTNRFSKDVQTIDREVMDALIGFAFNVVSVLSTVALVAIIAPLFLLCFLPISALFYGVAQYYLNSSREIKRLESTSRSPIYSIFGETLAGTSVIRAFSAEQQFQSNLFDRVDTYHRAFFYLWAFNRWLTIRTDFLSNVATFVCGVIILSSLDSIDAGLAGLALSYCLTLSGHCLWLVRTHATMEMEMNSMERAIEYLNLEQEAPAIIERARPPHQWPSKGEIRVHDLVMQYTPELPPVLKHISFDIRSHEKVGIVGRTGAGKSTMAIAFFRFMEPVQGSIVIDGVDITRIGLEDLRSRLTIIPQDPVLFEGTIRSNLDVFGEHDELTLWNALKRVHLIHASQMLDPSTDMSALVNEPGVSLLGSPSMPSVTLDSTVVKGGVNFSVGQRQLLALARALLRRSKVIVMDESTANVSHDLDAKIQETIRTEFSESTVLCIAHRLRTVVDFNRIIVLDHGELREFDTPYNLLQMEDGIFRNMCLESGEYDHLCQIAEERHR